MKIKVLVADDEVLARNRIRQFLAQYPDYELIAECDNGLSAIDKIRELRPDLVILDVQMPERNGLEVLKGLSEEEWPAVIFITAFEQHAVEAFEVKALDYLLKPFTEDRFRQSLNRVEDFILKRGTSSREAHSGGFVSRADATCLKRIAVKTTERTLFVPIEEIYYFESAGNYVVIHTAKSNHIVRETLTHFESRLASNFQRISRSFIVNLDQVQALHPSVKGEHFVVLKDNRRLAMTRGTRDVLERLMYM